MGIRRRRCSRIHTSDKISTKKKMRENAFKAHAVYHQGYNVGAIYVFSAQSVYWTFLFEWIGLCVGERLNLPSNKISFLEFFLSIVNSLLLIRKTELFSCYFCRLNKSRQHQHGHQWVVPLPSLDRRKYNWRHAHQPLNLAITQYWSGENS